MLSKLGPRLSQRFYVRAQNCPCASHSVVSACELLLSLWPSELTLPLGEEGFSAGRAAPVSSDRPH